MKKRTINSELVYLFAIIILSFSIDLMTIANMGLSAINGPAYILSEKIDLLTYGQAEYIVEGIVFSNEQMVKKVGKITYLPIYYIMFI